MIPINPQDLLNLTNQTRQELRLPPVQLNENLNRAALLRGNDMVTQNYWSHTSPTGKNAYPFMVDAGYQYNSAGENLGRGYNDAQSLYQAWMDSPSHKANLINPNYKDMGIAIVPGTQDGKPSYYVVQFFGQPTLPPTPSAPKPAKHPVKAPTKPAPKKPIQRKPLPKDKRYAFAKRPIN